MRELLSIGKIINFHGIQGEVKVGYTEGNEEVITGLAQVYAVKGDRSQLLEIEKVRFHKKFALVKFREVDSIDAAVKLKGALLKADKQELEKYLREDEFYINDLVGLEAYDETGAYLGQISGIAAIKGQDTLLIRDKNNREHMVPFVRDLVPEVNTEQGRITVKKLEGLIEST